MTTEDETKLVKLGIVDSDLSELSAAVFEDLRGISGLKAETSENKDEARRRLQDGRYNLVLVIGPAFHERIDELELGDLLDTKSGRLAAG